MAHLAILSNGASSTAKPNWRKLLSFFALTVIAISLLCFALCVSRPYIGVELVFNNKHWSVESVDGHGLGFVSGIQIGDIPVIVNGEPAAAFLQKYESVGSYRFIRSMEVVDAGGISKAADISTASQPERASVELAVWFALSAVFFGTGYWINFKRPDNTAALVLLVCGAVFSLALSANLAAERLLPLAMQLGIISATIGPWLLLHFFLDLPEERAWLRSDPRQFMVYIVPLIILVLYPFIGVSSGQILPEYRIVRLLGYGLGFLAVVGVAIYNYAQARLPGTRQQLRIVLIGCVMALLPFIALNIIPATIHGSIVLPSDFGILFLSLIPLSLGYAVIARHLMDIDIVVRRGVVYSLITLIMAVILTSAFALVLSSGLAPDFSERFLIALLLSALAVLLLGPIKNVIENAVDKVLYKDRFDYRKTIQNLSISLSATSEEEVAACLIVDTPMSALNLAGACLFITTDKGSFRVGASRGVFSSDASQRQLLGLILRRNVGKEFPNLAETPNPDVAFIIPLVAADKEVGLLFLSPKASRQEFNGSDFYLIQGLASVAAVSLRGILIAERDLKDRRHNEQAILQAKQEWESTFDSIPDLICILDADHNIIRVNKSMADKIGLSPAETIGKKCYALMHETNAPPESCPGLKASFRGCGPAAEIVRCGSTYQVNISTLNSDGKLSGRYVHIARDITAVKTAEAEHQRLKEKAELSSRLAAVGEMAAGIAHEINNPLTGVLGYAELMLSEDLPPALKEEVQIIADGSKRVAEIVRRLLTFARQTKPLKTSVSVPELIDNTLELRNYVLRTSGIEVITRYQPDLPWIVADAGQLQQVFLNLIVNAEHAIKKTGHQGRLTISAEKTGNFLRIVFEDNGTGIESDVLPKLFQPFFTTKAPGEGTGLGLSLSRSIIVEHGGTIEVASEPGHGATFSIELPMNSESEMYIDEKPEPAADRPISDGAQLLVIDDEVYIQKLLRQSLFVEGRTIDLASDSEQSLKLLKTKRYDAILMDLRMPGASGISLYKEIISRYPEMEDRVVIITGDALGIDVKAFVAEHNLAVVAKPFDQAAVQQTVNHILRNKKFNP